MEEEEGVQKYKIMIRQGQTDSNKKVNIKQRSFAPKNV